MEGFAVLKGGNEYRAVTMVISINMEANIMASKVVKTLLSQWGTEENMGVVMATTGAPLTIIPHM